MGSKISGSKPDLMGFARWWSERFGRPPLPGENELFQSHADAYESGWKDALERDEGPAHETQEG
jgi:hypothetical protein